MLYTYTLLHFTAGKKKVVYIEILFNVIRVVRVTIFFISNITIICCRSDFIRSNFISSFPWCLELEAFLPSSSHTLVKYNSSFPSSIFLLQCYKLTRECRHHNRPRNPIWRSLILSPKPAQPAMWTYTY